MAQANNGFRVVGSPTPAVNRVKRGKGERMAMDGRLPETRILLHSLPLTGDTHREATLKASEANVPGAVHALQVHLRGTYRHSIGLLVEHFGLQKRQC